MEPKFNTSFIPKKPIVDTPAPAEFHKKGTKNIFDILATVAFMITLLASGGLFVYKNVLISQIAQADKDVNAARSAFDTTKIQDLLDANSRIMATKNLLEKHIAVSELLLLLQSLTVKKMRFSKFIYDNKNGSPTLSLDSEVQSYNALAQQSDIFSKSEFIKNQQFSNFNLSDNGFIKVKFFAGLDSTLTSYKKAVEAVSLGQ